MGIRRGPNIVQSGLVLSLDAGNVRSYPGSGTTWRDVSGNGNAEMVNSPVFENSPKSFTFDGTADYFSVTSNTAFKSITGDITLTGWCKQNSTGGAPHQTILGTSLDYRHGIKLMSYYHGGIAVWLANGAGTGDYLLSSSGIADTGWRFLAATRNSSTGLLELFLDGVRVNYVTTFTGATNNNQNAAIGTDYHSSGYYYYGNIVTASAYNRVLQASEILQNYNMTKSRFGK